MTHQKIATNLFIGQLVETYVPLDKIDPGTVDNAKNLQAALVIAHETGLDKDKPRRDRLRPYDQVMEELNNSGVDAQILVAMAKEELGQGVPSEVPAFGEILKIEPEIKQALLLAQAAQRIREVVAEGKSFVLPRLDVIDSAKEPALLEAQTALKAALETPADALTDENKTAFLASANRADSEANRLWDKTIGGPLVEIPASKASFSVQDPGPNDQDPKLGL